MEKKYTFWERLTSDKPTFFKRAQAFGAGVGGLGLTLSQIHGIPAQLSTVLISAGAAIAAIAQFAVKQCEPLKSNADGN